VAGQGILAIDQGSGSTKALLIGHSGEVLATGSAIVNTSFPKPGWVQQNPEQIWDSVCRAVSGVVASSQEITIEAIAFSTQRESLVVWNRKTGKALSPILTWQDRSSSILLPNYQDDAEQIRSISGLPLDPMFSALKAIRVLSELNSQPEDICIGTVDSWILWKLGAGHVIEVGNASRTQLLDVSTGNWSQELLNIFDLDSRLLPRVISSDSIYKIPDGVLPGINSGTPVAGVLGDSHAALFAHAGWIPGRVKATYGTGSSVMAIADAGGSSEGLCRTIAWSLEGNLIHGIEGNILSSGSTLVWLAQILGESVEDLAGAALTSDELIHIVPAFNGLGAPWWDENAQGIISGITLGTNRASLASAGLDSIAMQIADVLDEVRKSGNEIKSLRVDGGASQNENLMQRQADFANVRVEVPAAKELSAIGAANFAGLSIGLWTKEDLESREIIEHSFLPKMIDITRVERRGAWQNAVSRARMNS
jgi:glycerol kinase